MIVIVTNRSDLTADYLILELRRRGVEYVRFNTEDFPQHVAVTWQIRAGRVSGHFRFPKVDVAFADITSVWYRRPVPPVIHPATTDRVEREFARAESQAALDAIWRTLDCFWVSHPDKLREAEHKLVQLRTAARVGLRVWPTLVTTDPGRARDFYDLCDGSVIYKPLRQGRIFRGDDVSFIFANPVRESDLSDLNRVATAASMFQRYVPKRLEVRATVVGTRMLAVAIHSQERDDSRHDWRRGGASHLRHEPHVLPSAVESACVALVGELGLSFGAIDLVLTPEDEYVFLEINPNGQWAWIQQLCPGVHIREALADLLVEGGVQ